MWILNDEAYTLIRPYSLQWCFNIKRGEDDYDDNVQPDDVRGVYKAFNNHHYNYNKDDDADDISNC